MKDLVIAILAASVCFEVNPAAGITQQLDRDWPCNDGTLCCNTLHSAFLWTLLRLTRFWRALCKVSRSLWLFFVPVQFQLLQGRSRLDYLWSLSNSCSCWLNLWFLARGYHSSVSSCCLYLSYRFLSLLTISSIVSGPFWNSLAETLI